MNNKFDIILSDPPWAFTNKKTGGSMRSGAAFHYPTMSNKELCALPVKDIISDCAVLFMWIPSALLFDNSKKQIHANTIMEAWGFTFKTVVFDWLKVDKSGKPAFGMGHYSRQSSELCLLGTRTGGKSLERKSKSVRQSIIAPVRKHSQKPDEQYERIEELYGQDVKRLEMFARFPRNGWSQLGNHLESDKQDIRTSILNVK